MKFKFTLITTASILLLFVNLAFSSEGIKQVNDKQWITTFPVGMKIYDIVGDPNNPDILYATNFEGIFKTVNGGRLWTALKYESELNNSSSFIKMLPNNSNIIFWFSGRYIKKSTDAGSSWVDIPLATINDRIAGIAINPTNPEIMYVAAHNGLYKTLNGGKSFGKLTGKDTVHVSVNPATPDELYASFRAETWNNPALLHRSPDGGMSFRDKGELIDPTGKFTYKKRDNFLGQILEEQGRCHETYVSINPSNPKELLASCETTVGGGNSWQRYLISDDGANSWKLLDAFFEGKNGDLGSSHARIKYAYFHPKLDGVIYVLFQGDKDKSERDKIFRADDHGETWRELSAPPSYDLFGLQIASTGSIYVNTYLGLYKSDNEGTTWESVSHGLPTMIENKKLLNIDEKTGTVYVGDQYGYYTSDINAETWYWTSMQDKEFGYSKYSVLQVIPAADDLTYVLCGSTKDNIGVLFKKESDGRIEKLASGVKFTDVSPMNSKIIYLVKQERMYDNYKIVKSEDGGFSWAELLNYKNVNKVTLTVDLKSPDNVYAVSSSVIAFTGGEVFNDIQRTTDGGKTWTDLTKGLRNYVASILKTIKGISAKESEVLAKYLLAQSNHVAITVDAINSNYIYLCSAKLGLFRYSVALKTWKLISPDSSLIKTAAKIAPKEMRKYPNLENAGSLVGSLIRNNIDISYNDITSSSGTEAIYLSTTKGVYISSNSGDTWKLLNKGLHGANVNKVIASQSLTLAEVNDGIYKFIDINNLDKPAVYSTSASDPTNNNKQLSNKTGKVKESVDNANYNEQAIREAVIDYYNNGEWSGIFKITKIERVRVEDYGSNRITAHVRYEYSPIHGNRMGYTDSGYDQRIFIIDKSKGKPVVIEMKGNMSARF